MPCRGLKSRTTRGNVASLVSDVRQRLRGILASRKASCTRCSPFCLLVCRDTLVSPDTGFVDPTRRFSSFTDSYLKPRKPEKTRPRRSHRAHVLATAQVALARKRERCCGLRGCCNGSSGHRAGANRSTKNEHQSSCGTSFERRNVAACGVNYTIRLFLDQPGSPATQTYDADACTATATTAATRQSQRVPIKPHFTFGLASFGRLRSKYFVLGTSVRPTCAPR